MPVFPGSLNIALDHVFDWFDARYEAHKIWFGREEYGGERDILLLPCELVSLDHRKAFLWTPTTAATDRRDRCVVEIVADINLRDHFGLQDGDTVEIRCPLLASRHEGAYPTLNSGSHEKRAQRLRSKAARRVMQQDEDVPPLVSPSVCVCARLLCIA
jgi:hypothetical protein